MANVGMFDASWFPTLQEAQSLLDQLGPKAAVGGYIGGPGMYVSQQVCTPAAAREYVSAGYGFVPIFVLATSGFTTAMADAEECKALLETYGVAAGGRVELDLEPAQGQDVAAAASYGAAVVADLQAAGYTVGMYGQITTLVMCSSVRAPYFVIYPSWLHPSGQGGIDLGIDPYNPPAGIAAPPHDAWNGPGQRGIQYAGNVTIDGLLVDLNSVDESIPNYSLTQAAAVPTVTDVDAVSATASQALTLAQALEARVTALETASKGVETAEAGA